MTPLFQLNNVQYKKILDIPELNFPEAKISCIAGESGSGKSTLLRHLNAMNTANEGEIYYKGKELKEWDPIALRREVLMLPQNPPLFPGTIEDNLVIGFRFAERPFPAQEELKKILAEVNLPQSLHDNVENLSGGEKQRLGLARILLMEPEVTLLDEPSSALDEETESMVLKLCAASVRERGKTLIMVTHARKVMENLPDQLIILEKGQVKESRTLR